jgi:hypothetical protein
VGSRDSFFSVTIQQTIYLFTVPSGKSICEMEPLYKRILPFLFAFGAAVQGHSQQASPLKVEEVSVFQGIDTISKASDKADSLKHQYVYIRQGNGSKASHPVLKADPQRPVAGDIRKWMIKFNPVLIARGEAPVIIERRLGRAFSLESGLGFTTEDYFKELFIQGKLFDQKETNITKLNGITARLSLRWYLRQEALSGFYIAPELVFANYRKDVEGVYLGPGGRYTSGKLRDQQNYLDFIATFGSQNAIESNGEFYLDWYLGAGLRKGMEDNVIPDEGNSPAIKVNRVSGLSPLLCAGIKFGFGF